MNANASFRLFPPGSFLSARDYRKRAAEDPAPKEAAHYTQLEPMVPGSSCAVEWDSYRREVGRLLAEGHEGKWALIVGTDIVGLFETFQEACTFETQPGGQSPGLVIQVRTWEPVHYSYTGENLHAPTHLPHPA
jgi:hypothetical protein